ncbi:MAG: hypothetical protein GX085_04055 [Firmicutes bacterium]|nr:hypothetical protein [Bacillota bacterium]
MILSFLATRLLKIKPEVIRRPAYFTGLLLLALGVSIIGPGAVAALAEEGLELEVIAPEGSDFDLENERFSYFGRARQPVIMRTPEFSLTARRIDYDRKLQELTAVEDVVLMGEEIELRTEELQVDLDRELFTATGGFTLTAGEMELTGQVLTASIPEGMLTATTGVNWQFRDLRGEAEQLVYRKDEEKVYLSGKPVAYWGENYMEGTMMVLHLKTGRITMTGPVKSRLQSQGGGTGGD